MRVSKPNSLSWTEVLAAMRACAGESVFVRDGKIAEPAASVRTRPAAKGTELCLFAGKPPATRLDLVRQLEAFSEGAGRRFMTSARASTGKSNLLIESVADETGDGGLVSVIVRTRRPALGFNQGQQVGDTTTLRSKRIKTR